MVIDAQIVCAGGRAINLCRWDLIILVAALLHVCRSLAFEYIVIPDNLASLFHGLKAILHIKCGAHNVILEVEVEQNRYVVVIGCHRFVMD